MFLQIPAEALSAALRQGAWLSLAPFVLLETVAILPLDVWATRAALASAGVSRGFPELLLARGASYLLGLVSYLAGQGGIGFYLAKNGVRTGRATGAMLFLMVSNGIALVLVAAFGLLADLPQDRRELLLGLTLAALAGIAVYLAVIASRASRIRWLAGHGALAPLFEAGLGGHLRAALVRVPHMLVMALLHWAAFRIWGVAVPFWRGLALMPVVLLVGALPVTPNGLGTTQAVQVLFFSPWSAAATPEGRAAEVLTFSLVHQVYSIVWQAALGLFCLGLLRRRSPAGDAAEPEAP